MKSRHNSRWEESSAERWSRVRRARVDPLRVEGSGRRGGNGRRRNRLRGWDGRLRDPASARPCCDSVRGRFRPHVPRCPDRSMWRRRKCCVRAEGVRVVDRQCARRVCGGCGHQLIHPATDHGHCWILHLRLELAAGNRVSQLTGLAGECCKLELRAGWSAPLRVRVLGWRLFLQMSWNLLELVCCVLRARNAKGVRRASRGMGATTTLAAYRQTPRSGKLVRALRLHRWGPDT